MNYKLKDVVYTLEEHWILKIPNGYEVYKTGITCSTRCAQIGWLGEEGLKRAIKEVNRREKGLNNVNYIRKIKNRK